jgi:hypothetical protein
VRFALYGPWAASSSSSRAPPQLSLAVMPSTELEALVETRADGERVVGMSNLADNDEANTPMLPINEELGYQRIPGILSFRKQR